MAIQGPELREPMEMGQIIERALDVYRRHTRPLLLMATVGLPVYLLAAILTNAVKGVRASLATGLPLGALAALTTVVVAAAIARGLADVALGIAPDLSRSYDVVLARLPQLLLTVLRASLLVLAAAVTVVGPIYLAVRWAFVVQAVVLEDANPAGALRLSARLIKDNWWRTCGILVSVGVLAAAPVVVTVVIFALAPVLVWTIILPIMTVVVLPFAGVAYTLLFFDLQAREVSRAGTA